MSQAFDPTPPDWAIRQARDALQRGMSASEVEQRLAAVGLAPQTARDVVARVKGTSSGPPPVLDWAMEHVRASLKAGLTVPQIERNLAAKGLTPEVAEAVTTRVLGERVRGDLPDTPERERRRTLHRIASGVVAALCIILGYAYSGPISVLPSLYVLPWPLCCIWFGDLSGPLWSRFGGRGPVLGVAVRWLGWLVLLLYLLYRLERLVYKP